MKMAKFEDLILVTISEPKYESIKTIIDIAGIYQRAFTLNL